MAAAIYRVMPLNTDEADTAELLLEADLLTRFAPEIANTTKLSNVKLAQDWLKAFLSMEVLQIAHGVKVEKVDSREIFEARLEDFRKLDKDAKAAKSALGDALLSVLTDITADDIAKGKCRLVNSTNKNKVTEVEYYLSKAKPTLTQFIDSHQKDLSDDVVAELRRIQKERKADTDKKFNKKS